LVERVGAELRQKRLTSRRVVVTVHYADGGRQTGRAAVFPATANDMRLFSPARSALRRAWTRRIRIRGLRITCDRLTFPPSVQLTLFAEGQRRTVAQQNLIATVDAVRRRFGADIVRFGRTLTA
jgi:DNA polymerase-4